MDYWLNAGLVTATAAAVVAVILGWQKYQRSRTEDSVVDKAAATKRTKEDRAIARTEQEWINEQKNTIILKWEQKFSGMEEEVAKLRADHLACREENVAMRVELRESHKDSAELRTQLTICQEDNAFMRAELMKANLRINALEQGAKHG